MYCVFCKIAAGEIPSTAVYQDELAYAFADINPKAPVHVLIIPREHIGSLAEAGADKRALLGHLMGVAGKIARQKGLAKGYRVVVNTGDDGGQTVDHLHLHLMGGRQMTWATGINAGSEGTKENSRKTKGARQNGAPFFLLP